MPFVEGREPADHRRAFDALSRLEKAVAALDINKVGSAKLDDIRKVVGAARAELHGSSGEAVMKRAIAGDIEAQRILREAVIKGAASETDMVDRASAQISKAKGRPVAPKGVMLSDHNALGDLGVRKALAPYGVSGVTSDSRYGDYQQSASSPVARDTDNMYRQLAPRGSGLDPDFARTLGAALEAPELDVQTFLPIQRDARGSRTPTGSPTFNAGDTKVPEPASRDGVGKSATGVDINKLLHDRLIAKLRASGSLDEADEILTAYDNGINTQKVAEIRSEFDAEIARIRKGRR